MRRARSIACAVLAVLAGACGDREQGVAADAGTPPTHSPARVVESAAANARIMAIRKEFVTRPAAQSGPPGKSSRFAGPRPVVAPAVVTSFERTDEGQLRAVVPVGAKRAVLRSATVLLPTRASDAAQLEDNTTHVAVRFALRGASDAPAEIASGMVLYRGALAGRGCRASRPRARGRRTTSCSMRDLRRKRSHTTSMCLA